MQHAKHPNHTNPKSSRAKVDAQMNRIPTSVESTPYTQEEIDAVIAMSAIGATVIRQQRNYGDDVWCDIS